ncbi:MAG: hypothetical protein ABI687_03410 [Flavitalea sp.]
MDYESFIKSISAAEPLPGLSPYLKALWYDAKERWDMSHNIAQDINDRNGSWIHAYLHRKEGDDANAGYWYNKAGKSFPQVSLEEEWTLMVKAFI